MKLIALFLCAMGIQPLLGQVTEPKDGEFEVDQKLWNHSYMPTFRDQFVHGEGYKLYPGPLPKVLYSLGRDANDPAIDWELLVNVDRNAPTWFGICNGWAASALLYNEPGAIVVNGVKIMPGDHKSFLTSIYKNLTTQTYGVPDLVNGGLSPDSFEELLFRFVVDENQAIGFDVSLGDQVWNYPIKSFTRESEVQGDWTHVKITAFFPGLTTINDSFGNFFTEGFTYEFRYKTATKTNYEWLGDSVEDHPQVAWFPTEAVLKGVDVVSANRYYTLDTYRSLLAKASEDDNRQDLQEPNNSAEAAFKISNELLLGSLLLDDADYYSLPATAGEPVAFEFKIYDGQNVNFQILDPSGNPVVPIEATKEKSVSFTAAVSGNYQIRLSQLEDAFVESYYQFVFPEDASHFVSGPYGNNFEVSGQVNAVNTRSKKVFITGNDSQEVAAYGSRSFDVIGNVDTRANDRVLWSEKLDGQLGDFKQYHLDHIEKTEYMVPHVTCRNGWKTFLDIRRQAKKPVFLRVYGQDGAMIHRQELAFDDGILFQKDMASFVPQQILETAGWIDFETEAPLKGFAVFTGTVGDPIRIDIAARPRFGDMLVFDLKEQGKGGTGLAVVSTADFDNEVIYWIEDGRGNEIVRKTRFMTKGQKWLTTIANLVDVPMEDDFVFYMHTQYPVESVVIQVSPEVVYGHRILGSDLDNIQETYATISKNRAEVGFLFANFSDAPRHILFEGYSADGELQGRFNIKLGRPLQRREVARVPLQQIYENGVDIKDLNAITHLRITSTDKFYGFELLGADSFSPMFIPLQHVYENP